MEYDKISELRCASHTMLDPIFGSKHLSYNRIHQTYFLDVLFSLTSPLRWIFIRQVYLDRFLDSKSFVPPQKVHDFIKARQCKNHQLKLCQRKSLFPRTTHSAMNQIDWSWLIRFSVVTLSNLECGCETGRSRASHQRTLVSSTLVPL